MRATTNLRGGFCALLALVLATLAGCGESVEYGVPAGQDALLADLLGRGVTLPGACTFAGGGVAGSAVHARYTCADGPVGITLRHPGDAARPAVRTARFAVLVVDGSPPPGMLEALARRLAAGEGAFAWSALRGEARWLRLRYLEPPLYVVVTLLFLWPIVAAVRAPGARWPARAMTGVRMLGLAAIVAATWLGRPGHAPPDGATVVTAAGVAGVSALLWLAASGFFGAAGVRRADWVVLLPALLALLVREGLTRHSVQEIELQFANGPIVKHSVAYPLFQLVYAPWMADAQQVTMHVNGVLGALATLPLYLFVRHRTGSRVAGVLCALFFGVHPLVARFAPTDGPYSLLLLTWFSGLALLAAPRVDGRTLFGAALLLGLAATLRVEGATFLLAALLLLDPRHLLRAVRRHRGAAAGGVAVIAVLAAVQMHFIWPQHYDNVPPAPTLAALVWPVQTVGPWFATLVLVGCASAFLGLGWFGAGAVLAALVVGAPVAHSTFVIAWHRLVPVAALQALLAGLGAYCLVAWLPRASPWRWLGLLPACAVALSILVQHRETLRRPYVFSETYDLVRRHLAPPVGVGCELLSFPPIGDTDLHEFRQVVPHLRVRDCRREDCRVAADAAPCSYYVRSVAAYFHPLGVPDVCADPLRVATPAGGCLIPEARALEDALALEPVELRDIDVQGTFAEHGGRFPPRAEIGVFRVERPDRARAAVRNAGP